MLDEKISPDQEPGVVEAGRAGKRSTLGSLSSQAILGFHDFPRSQDHLWTFWLLNPSPSGPGDGRGLSVLAAVHPALQEGPGAPAEQQPLLEVQGT